jgi:DNA-binding response OmpR family regulator
MTTTGKTNSPGISIVVVEDSRTQAEYLCYLLETKGYTVFSAADGREAQEMIRRDPGHPGHAALRSCRCPEGT